MKNQPSPKHPPSPERKRPWTLSYLFFYALFWPDTYRIAIGLVVAAFLSPMLVFPDWGFARKSVLFLMISTIGYAVTAAPGRTIAGFFQKRVLGDRPKGGRV